MPFTSPRSFRCVVIGEGALPMQCAEIVLQAGHALCGLISPDEQLRAWAAARTIPFCDPGEDMLDFVRRAPVDYIFSIVNRVVLPPELLAMPRRYAINHHDSPLPRYAGMYATSWAIMAGETHHAISWHIMVPQIDAGDILLQHALEIEPDDTAFSLNVKCYDAAVRTFTNLVYLLASEQITPRPQDLTHRTYRGLYERPSAACVLDWRQPAHRLMALVRALQFGHSPNELGHPKLLLTDASYIVAGLDVLPTRAEAVPGTLLEVSGERLVLATSSSDVAITQLQSITGQPIELSAVAQRHGLHAGVSLPVLDTSIVEYMSVLHSRLCRHETFWKQRLADLQPITLPYLMHPAANEHISKHDKIPLKLPPFLAVTGMAEAYLRATFAVYLARVAGNYQFDLGMQTTAVQHELAGLELLFATVVPLRVALEPEQSFAQNCATLDAAWVDTGKRKSFMRDIVARFPDLWKQSELKQGIRLPICLFDVIHVDETRLPSDCALALVLEERGVAWWLYDPAVLPPPLAARMGQQFLNLLSHACAEPQQPISRLPLLEAEEYRRVVFEWNDTAADYPQDVCIHHLFEQQVERTPEAVALVFEDETLTYRELDTRANQLAHSLRGLGVAPEVLVALCVNRSLEMVIGLLGILKAGGAYVPLDSSYPTERLAFILEDTKAPVLLTLAHLQETLPTHNAQVVCLDDEWAAIAQQPTTAPSVPLAADNLAYVIYTSGSTGQPKGVMIAHQNVVNFLATMQHQPGITSDDVLLGVTTLAFDIAVLELFLPLLVGACTVLARRDTAADGEALSRLITHCGATMMQATPATWRLLLQSGWTGQTGMTILCGGETLPRDLAAQLLLCGERLWNLYGPTETTIWSTRLFVEPGSETISIGRPIANTQTYILDERMQLVPIGVAGELYIGGVGVARGYLNRPDLTSERFIPNPFGTGRLYKTGDLARYRVDGEIEFLGRADFQVKLRGFRIELGEIETVLNQHPSVQQAVVVAREDDTEKRLVAYVVSDDADTAALRAHLATWLPNYMVPAAFVVLDALPLTPNGKVNRQALPNPERIHRAGTQPIELPRTPLEQAIASIWQAWLRIEQIGLHEDFFELGGHSLLLTRIYNQVRKLAPMKLALSDMFAHRTVGALAHFLNQQDNIRHVWDSERATAPAVPKPGDTQGSWVSRPAEVPIPLSLAQQQHWLLYQLNVPFTLNVSEAMALRGHLDVAVLQRAFAQVVARHTILRTRYPIIDGSVAPTIVDEASYLFAMIDLRHLSPDEQASLVHQHITAEDQRRFDLACDPMLAVTLIQLTDDTHILLTTVAHIASDGWSTENLSQELAAIYNAYLHHQPLALSDLPLQYADYAYWKQHWLRGAELEQQLSYWRTRLRNFTPTIPLPTDYPRPEQQPFSGLSELFVIEAALVNHLRTFGQQQATLFSILLTAFSVLLTSYSKQQRLMIAVPMANRLHSDLEPLIGCFVNFLPFCIQSSGMMTFSEVLHQVQQTNWEAQMHQDISIEFLYETMGLERNPLYCFQAPVYFGLNNMPQTLPALSGLQAEWIEAEWRGTSFDIEVHLMEIDGDLHGKWLYNSDLYKTSTAQWMVRAFRKTLYDMINNPDMRIMDVALEPI